MAASTISLSESPENHQRFEFPRKTESGTGRLCMVCSRKGSSQNEINSMPNTPKAANLFQFALRDVLVTMKYRAPMNTE